MERLNTKKTFEYQHRLPKLPIPDLQDTLDSFLEWVQPLLNEEELESAKHIVNNFYSNEGPKLQRALESYSKESGLSNWLTPIREDMYLRSRVPLIVEGNVFYVLENRVGYAYNQSEIAARIIISALKFKALIDEERLEADRLKGSPLCMLQYKNFFSSTRIPGKEKDQMKQVSHSTHILIIFMGNIFIMDVYEPSGEIKSLGMIKRQLEEIMSHATMGEGIGVLTSTERSQWAEDRLTLIKIDKRNREHLEKIESAIFAVCLDQTYPRSLVEISSNMLYGEGANRWFDKSIQFIITKNSVVGINMEHAKMDGSTMTRFMRYLYDHIHSIQGDDREWDIQKPERLDFILNDQIRASIDRGKKRFKEIMQDNEIRVLTFDRFGTNAIKKYKISPDAFVQIAIQWAQYMLFGKLHSQYEPIMTRNFLSGRVEGMYAITMESLNFIEGMEKELFRKDTGRELFKKAAQKHIQRVWQCREGKGINGHLWGLREMYDRHGKELGITEVPALFRHFSYRTLTYSTICTSTTSSYGIELAGWGPVVEDGFAIRYLNDHDQITFNMASRKYKEADLDLLVEYIRDSLTKLSELMAD